MKRNIHLFDIYWEDVIVAKIIPYLTIRECFNFRCVSKTCLKLVDMHFAKMKFLKLMNKGFSPTTFSVFTSSCARLTVINLCKNLAIKDEDIIPLLRQNILLESLNLSHCKNLSARCLQPVILYCHNLKILKLARCSWLTTGAMEALALHQSKLEDVDLSFCLGVSENCIQIFIKKFRLLKIVNIEGNKQVSDRCLYAMSKYSNNLMFLNLGGCSDITDKGIKSLVVNLTNLRCLMVGGCTKVTEQSLSLIRDKVSIDRKPSAPIPVPAYLQI